MPYATLPTFSIYLITNTVNGKRYVGQTSRPVARRFSDHISAAKKCGRGAGALQRAIRKHGRASFSVSVLDTCGSKARADQLERQLIISLGTRDRALGYNLTDGGEGTLGHRHSVENKAKMSAALVGTRKGPKSVEHRANMSAAHRGKTFSAHTRKLLSEAAKGRPGTFVGRKHSEKSKLKISAARLGFKESEETIAKKRVASTGRRHTDETKAKLSLLKRGHAPTFVRSHSEESRAKMREAKRAYWSTPEAKAKASASQKARHARERGLVSQ